MKQYQDLVAQVLTHGQERENRTGVNTRSIFGTQSRYNLQEGFPLLTTKKVNFGAIKAELLWFLSGSTNTQDLDSKIWDAWSNDDGELGPIYSKQWRSWGGESYMQEGNGRVQYKGGIDQIQQAIDTIKNNPSSRRIIVSAWNPTDVPAMALPPCHLMFQFNVQPSTTGPAFLDCQMYQRSADLALGVPFNIASYALLTSMVARECNLRPGELIHTIGDAHVYVNHIEGLQEQLRRNPLPLPKLVLNFNERDFNDIRSGDIIVRDYEHHPAIKFEVAV